MAYEHLVWPKDLIDLDQFSAEHLLAILDSAETFKEISEREIKKVPTLKGKLVVLFFHENSTRTRLSFEVAAKRLSADTIALSASGSSMSKGETLLDTAKNIMAMNPDALVIRHSASGAPYFLGQRLACPVLNAGDGAHAHPTQALLDLMTIKQKLGHIAGLKVAIIGDIAHSRVARSNMIGLKTLGASVSVCGPPSMMVTGLSEEYGVTVHSRPEPALEGADAVIMLRIQLERQSGQLFPGAREYATVYGLNADRLKLAKPGCLLLHPGPVNQGVELTPDVYECPQSVILEQVTNGVAIRMALLYLLVDNIERRTPAPVVKKTPVISEPLMEA
ncbi:MAG: aspartate carbamoyltransferase catalytic subunit [Deltaproteobacteria bacterium]|jgi:aspartate carbamoyltransferase catalytic subunit|nr:aspartate carbamoyltransferase catalytic subunit [Deltaproteobacteria bacterium]